MAESPIGGGDGHAASFWGGPDGDDQGDGMGRSRHEWATAAGVGDAGMAGGPGDVRAAGGDPWSGAELTGGRGRAADHGDETGSEETDDGDFVDGVFSSRMVRWLAQARRLANPTAVVRLTPALQFQAGLVGWTPGMSLAWQAAKATRLNFSLQARQRDGQALAQLDHRF